MSGAGTPPSMSRPDFSARTEAAPASLPTAGGGPIAGAVKGGGGAANRSGGRSGWSKIESDCCESGKVGGDEGVPDRRAKSGDNADGTSCGGCDNGLT